jgi:hypothetical protein
MVFKIIVDNLKVKDFIYFLASPNSTTDRKGLMGITEVINFDLSCPGIIF